MVLDGDAMLSRILLKHDIGSHGQLGGVIDLKVHKAQTRVVVHKDGPAFVPLLGE